MAEDGLPIYIVGEDAVHHALAHALVRACVAEIAHQHNADWLDAAHCLRWSALHERVDVAEVDRWSDLHDDVPPRLKRSLHGRLDGIPLGPGGAKLRGKIMECRDAHPAAKLVVLMQDSDDDDRISETAQQLMAWADRQGDFPAAIIGVPHRDAEGWFLLISARSPEEEQRYQQAKAALSFSPQQKPHRLTGQPNDAITDAKRVVRFIFLQEGEQLAPGRPASRPPEAPAILAQRLIEGRPWTMDESKECGLKVFYDRLSGAITSVLQQDGHISAPRTTPGSLGPSQRW